MGTGLFTPSMLLGILPEIGLLVLALLVLILDLALKPDRRRWLGWLVAGGLVVIAALALLFARPGEQGQAIFGGMLRLDWMGFTFRLIFLFGAAATALFAMDSELIARRGEFYVLMLVSTLGMSLMASASDLIMLYLAIETTSIPLFVLAGFYFRDYKSTEASLKYLLFGAMTSAVMLYGFSLLFGFTGSTNLYAIANDLVSSPLGRTSLTSGLMIAGTFLLVMVGIGFKISAVPLHFWAPDVYEGAPTPVAGFLSTASKAAGFAVLMRVVLLVFYPTDMTMQAGDPTTSVTWGLVLAILATISMVVGNVLALTQKNIKRLLAYSSIAQAGYILIGVSSLSPLGFTGSTFYLISYLVTNLAAFGVVALVGRKLGSDDIAAYAGLSRRSPGLALVLLVALLSLGGIPPFGGFIGKVLVFASAINAANVWLAVVGVLNAVVGLYYYLTVLKVVYLYKPETDAEIKATVPWGVAIGACVVLVVLLGTLFGPWYSWSMQAIFGML